MKVALLGATGFIGSALLDEALLRRHTVTAIARHPEKLGRRDRLVAVSGDVYDAGVPRRPDSRALCRHQRVQSRLEKSPPLRGSGSGHVVHHRCPEEGGDQAGAVGRWRGRPGGGTRRAGRRRPRLSRLGETGFVGDHQRPHTAE